MNEISQTVITWTQAASSRFAAAGAAGGRGATTGQPRLSPGEWYGRPRARLESQQGAREAGCLPSMAGREQRGMEGLGPRSVELSLEHSCGGRAGHRPVQGTGQGRGRHCCRPAARSPGCRAHALALCRPSQVACEGILACPQGWNAYASAACPLPGAELTRRSVSKFYEPAYYLYLYHPPAV